MCAPLILPVSSGLADPLKLVLRPGLRAAPVILHRWLLPLLLVPSCGAGSPWTQGGAAPEAPDSSAAAGAPAVLPAKADRVGLASRALSPMSFSVVCV